MDKDPENIWFPAKRYGWGWGPPARWQGWVVVTAWLAIFAAGTPLAQKHMAYYFIFAAVMVALLVLVCLMKGEKPRWRWGDKDH